jgi:hypothetical protein
MSQRIHQLDHALISSMKAEEELEKNKKGRRAVSGGATATTASAGGDALRAHFSHAHYDAHKHGIQALARTPPRRRHITPAAPTSFLASTSAPCSSVVPCPCGWIFSREKSLQTSNRYEVEVGLCPVPAVACNSDVAHSRSLGFSLGFRV